MKLIEHIDTFDTWIYANISSGTWLYVMLYICVDCIVYTIVTVNFWETRYKKEPPISGRYVEEYKKSRKKLCRCVLISLIGKLFFLPPPLPLCALNLQSQFNYWIQFTRLFYYFHQWTIWAPYSSVIYFIFYWIRFHLATKFTTFSIKLM